MFAKLLKHDLKSNAGLLSLLGACVLGLSCIAGFVLQLLISNWVTLIESDNLFFLIFPAVLFLFFAYIAIVIFAAATQYIQLYRFYKSRFTDEGYLTFTLPVKTSHIFLSAATNILIWGVISFLIVGASIAIILGIGSAGNAKVLAEVQWVFSDIRDTFSEVLHTGYIGTTVISAIITVAYSIVASMTAVVLGATAAKKHKVLAIIGIMIGISMAYSMINGFITLIVEMIMFAAENYTEQITTIIPIVSSILPLALTVVGYIVSTQLMKKKLNLP